MSLNAIESYRRHPILASHRRRAVHPRAARAGCYRRRAMEIRVGHSPDPDDAFMYWALTTDLVDPRGFLFEQVLADIQTLNQWARAARLEVTAISLAAYPFVQEDYALLPHGASIGTGYGPIVVGREPASLDDLRGKRDRRPGSDDDGVPDAAARARRPSVPRAAVRADPGRGRVRACGLRPPDPRGPADVLRHRTAQGARPRRVVAARDRTAAPARASTSRAATSTGSTTSPPCSPRRSAAGSSIATMRSSTHSSSAAGSTRRSRTGSSRCTSTS